MTPSEPLKPIRLLIVEDHSLTRLGLKIALKDTPLVDVFAEADNGEKAVDYLLSEHQNIDVILMDISMPVMDGITATQKIKTSYPQCKVIMLTSHKTGPETYAALSAGADGYCVKDVDVNALIHIIDIVYKGSMWLDPDIARFVVHTMINDNNIEVKHTELSSEELSDNLDDSLASRINFTEREIDILHLLSQRKSCEQIADIFHLSTDLINEMTLSAMKKLSSKNLNQAVSEAYKKGLIEHDIVRSG